MLSPHVAGTVLVPLLGIDTMLTYIFLAGPSIVLQGAVGMLLAFPLVGLVGDVAVGFVGVLVGCIPRAVVFGRPYLRLITSV